MTDYTIASPNGGTWSIQSTNTAKTGRAHDLAFLLEGAAGTGNSFSKARAGFFSGSPVTTGTQSPGAAVVTAGTGLNFTIQPFAAVVERTSLIYPYVVTSTAVGTASVTTADASQTRIDRVDLVVLDGALGDNGGTSLTKVKVTAGTPGGTIPSAPDNSIPLGHWSIPKNTLNLTSATWTPARKSTGLRSGIRLLLEGDSLSDPGFVSGEWRDTSVISSTPSIDRWNSDSANWEVMIDLSGSTTEFVGDSSKSVTTVTAASYTGFRYTDGTLVGVSFTAPASGNMSIRFGANVHALTSGVPVFVTITIQQGSTVGSGSNVLTGGDTRAFSSSVIALVPGSREYRATGLTPGTVYNAALTWRVNGSGSADASLPWIVAEPVA